MAHNLPALEENVAAALHANPSMPPPDEFVRDVWNQTSTAWTNAVSRVAGQPVVTIDTDDPSTGKAGKVYIV